MIGKLLLDKYEVIRKIGEGSYSTVFEARNIIKNTLVAVKFDFDETSRILIENEINIYIYLSKNRMSDIAGIKSFGKVEGSNFIIMKKLGDPLNKFFSKFTVIYEKNNDPNIESCIKCYQILQMLLKLLTNFHKLDLIHRDIKPENFLLTKITPYV